MVLQNRTGNRPCFTVTDLRLFLEPFSLERRRALLFALDRKLTPAQVILIDRKTANLIADTPFSRSILAAQPVHLRLNYAFWEFMDGGRLAVPLFQLDKQTDNINFTALTEQFHHLILVDTQADRRHFESLTQ